MKVRIARSIKQPVLNSIYVSDFDPATLELLKSCKPFTTYHRALQEYEITQEIYQKIKEPVDSIKDERIPYPKFERVHKEEYGYQQDAVDFARKTENVFLNFSQGMGKSLTTMKILVDQHIGRTLIVCGQGNLQEEWLKDAAKHNMGDRLRTRIVGGDTGASIAKKAKWISANDENTVDLINIEALRNESIVESLNARNYQCVVVDEVQSAKGWKAEQTEGLHEIERTAGQKRIALSGTPILNSPLEMFSLLKFFGMLQDTARTTFEKYYGIWGFDFWGHYVCTGYRNLKDLNELMATVTCYAGKEELSLPPKRRMKIDLDWKVPERFSLLKRVYKMSATRLKKAGFSTKPQVRAEMQYLSSIAEPKVEFVLKHSLDNKMLVFSQYTTVLEHYEQQLSLQGRKVLYYHGALSMAQRLAVLDAWRHDDYDVLLLSVMASRYGLNLTEATTVVVLEPPFSIALLEQIEDRAHRIGQESPVYCYLLCASEIDYDGLDNMVSKQEGIDLLYDLRDA